MCYFDIYFFKITNDLAGTLAGNIVDSVGVPEVTSTTLKYPAVSMFTDSSVALKYTQKSLVVYFVTPVELLLLLLNFPNQKRLD